MPITKIMKRDGRVVDFDSSKIKDAIHKAFIAVELEDGKKAESITREVVNLLEKKFRERIPSVENAQDAVIEVLKKSGYEKVAEEYQDYRKKKGEIRELREKLGIVEPKLTVNALEVLRRRYLLKDETERIVETPTQMFRRVAEALAKVDEKYGGKPSESEKTFYEMMARLEFIPNSPTLFNAGTEIGQLSACFALPIEDSLESIFDAVKNMALIEKSGGGVGFDFSKLRPKGDIVMSTMGVASGPVSFMRVFDTATEVIKAGGKRRGAMMGVLRVDHPDIVEFITSKKEPGTLSNFNISVAVTDEFMKTLEEDGEYWLVNPRNKEKVGKLKAKDVWNLMAKSAWESGDPGVIFIDEFNRHNPTPEIGRIESTNPCGEQPLLPYESCFAPETRIVTDKGIETIEDLYNRQCRGEKILVATNLNGREKRIIFRFAPVTRVGERATVQVTLANNQSLRVTPDHEIFTEEGWKEAGKLTPSDKVMIQTSEAGDLKFDLMEDELKIYQMFGWFTGDGWFTETCGLTFGPQDTYAFEVLMPIWNKFTGTKNKVSVQRNFVRCISCQRRSVLDKFKSYGFSPARAPNKRVPKFMMTAPKQAQIAYLQGLFSADGTKPIDKRRARHKVELSSRSLELLREVQLTLLNLGIKSSVHFFRERKSGRSQGILRISGIEYSKFVDLIGFSLASYKQKRCEEDVGRKLMRSKVFIPVKSVETAGKTIVYDITEPVTHSLIAEGMVVHNCNLGSINLSRMVEDGKINWEKLRETVRNAVNFLDNVIDANKYPLKEIEAITKANRKIGLGVMGFADMLIKLGIPYNSEEALQFAEKLMRFIEEESHKRSVEIGEERGSFPNFEKSVWKDKYSAMRNATVTTIAPTGSISIIAGCSSGIEPIFAISFIRSVLGGTRLFETNPLFEIVAKEKGFYSAKLLEEIARTGSVQKIEGVPEDLKRIFVTALDIKPEWHIRMQAAFQKHTDNAVSKTVNLPPEATVEDVRKVFDLAWKLKCKGVTIFRYGSKPEQVLYIGEIKTKETKFVAAESEYAGGCPTKTCPFPG